MRNLKSKIFEFLRNFVYIFKIFIVFCIMMHILYWIQNLTGDTWSWTSFINPILVPVINLASTINDGSIMLFEALFEFKFFIAIILYLVAYFTVNFVILSLNQFEDVYDNTTKAIRKFEEKKFNESMLKQNTDEQKKISRFQVYIELCKKDKLAHRSLNVDMEEQSKILVKHILDKTKMCPQKFENGYLYTFNSFEKIDEVLDVFIKLPESNAPVDFMICLEILDKSIAETTKRLKKVISLKVLNKIVTLADTVYRYNFNSTQEYETSQLGVFQENDETFELHQFIKKK